MKNGKLNYCCDLVLFNKLILKMILMNPRDQKFIFWFTISYHHSWTVEPFLQNNRNQLYQSKERFFNLKKNWIFSKIEFLKQKFLIKWFLLLYLQSSQKELRKWGYTKIKNSRVWTCLFVWWILIEVFLLNILPHIEHEYFLSFSSFFFFIFSSKFVKFNSKRW